MKHKQLLTKAMALAIGLVSIWALAASLRIYMFTLEAKDLIHQTSPYNQSGTDDLRILFIGDSFGYGTGASSSESSLAGLLGAKFPNATIINKSTNGTKTSDLAARIGSDIDERYDIIFVIVGANDVIHPEVNLSKSRDHLAKIYEYAAKNSDKAIAITTSDIKDFSFFLPPLNHYFGKRSEKLNDIAKSAAYESGTNVLYIDAFEEHVSPDQPKLLESSDGLHPNDLGNLYWFEIILMRGIDTSY